jgi:hypothetical protein
MKKIAVITTYLTLGFLLSAHGLTGTYSGGTGTAGDPAQISSVADLLELATTTDDYAEHFILTSDLNLSEQNFNSAVIAKDTDSDGFFLGVVFSGTFNGNGYTISNLTIDASGNATNDYLGLFGYISGGAVSNLTLVDASITTGSDAMFVGGLCAANSGTLSGCSVSGTITTGAGSETAGGLCAHNINLITNCQSSVSLNVGDSSESISGGLCGNNEGTISGCSASGAVSGDSINIVGAFCGKNQGGTLFNCASSGSAAGGSTSINIGGFCGFNDGTLQQCRSSATAEGKNHIGGLCGSNAGTVQQSYASGNITVVHDGYASGGLIGENSGPISNSYSVGAFTLPGDAWEVGGLIGVNEGGSITACFWDTTTSGQSSSDGGTGLTTAQMQTQSTFTVAGWDFSNVWNMEGYPVHQSAEPAPVQVVSIEVGGPISVEEETTEQYSCLAFYTNGSSNDVTDVCIWSVIPTNYASIDTNGLLTALSVPSNLYADVQAVYTDANGSYTDVLEIAISPIPPDPGSMVISGPHYIAEASSKSYTCTLFSMDGSSTDVTLAADWSVSPSFAASISSNGIVTSVNVSSDQIIEITALYNDSGTINTGLFQTVILNDAGSYSGGNGTESSPYLIMSKADLLYLRSSITTDYSNHFAVGANIDLAGETFTDAVIAADTIPGGDHNGYVFKGVFDGQQHSISNLTIDTSGLPSRNYLGLFGKILVQPLYGDQGGIIRNLKLENLSITCADESEYVGGLAGQCTEIAIKNCSVVGTFIGGDNSRYWGGLCGDTEDSTVSNCHSTVAIALVGGGSCAGLAGQNNGLVIDSSATGTVSAELYSPSAMGGLIGFNKSGGQIISCRSSGSVSGGNSVGGLCGWSYNNTIISNCSSSCSVTGGTESTGGLCGQLGSATVIDCYATGNIGALCEPYEMVQNIGGLIGTCGGTISRCYASGDISSTNQARYVGGLCGMGGGSISNCYATGDITLTNEPYSQIGGFCGGTYGGDILDCYSIGTLNIGASLYRVGGFLGEQPYGSDLADECFWDTQTSGLTNSAGGTGKTTAEMQAESTFTAAGWDFDNTWYMHGYPELEVHDTLEKTDYATWAEQEGISVLQREPDDTPASDGIPNLLKYAAGLDALTPHLPEDIMSIATEAEDGYFSVIYFRSRTTEGIDFGPVQTSSLSGEWAPEGIIYKLIETNGDIETWKVSIPLTEQGFMRLEVSQDEEE